MRVKFISAEKLDVLEGLVNNHIAGCLKLDYEVKSVDLKCTPWNKGIYFTAVIFEEGLTDKRRRLNYDD